MTLLEIENKEYEIYETYADVKVKDFIRITEWAKKNMPEKLNAIMFPKEGEGNDECKERIAEIKITKADVKKFDKFKIAYISEVTGMDKEFVMKLRLEDEDDGSWSVAGMFNALTFILFEPNENKGSEKVTIDGVDYFAQPNLQQKVAKSELRPKGLSFGENIELTATSEAFKPFGWGSYEMFDLFLSVMYRPWITKEVKSFWGFKKSIRTYIEPYDEDKCLSRRKLFGELDMDSAWGAYFFLHNSLDTYKKHILLSLGKIKTRSDLIDLAESAGISVKNL